MLHASGKAPGSTSRAYHAAFHAARALLLTLGLQPRSHEGVRHLLSPLFVRSGKLDPRLARALSSVARTREDADYDAAAVFTTADSEEALRAAEQFRAAARAILQVDGWLKRG
ncbi:MAG: HEPN domain-containing protein [Candidatus Eisenbacteria bacterium]